MRQWFDGRAQLTKVFELITSFMANSRQTEGDYGEIEKAGDTIILFVDEIHTIVGAGSSDGA
jgi:hypothetical protein